MIRPFVFTKKRGLYSARLTSLLQKQDRLWSPSMIEDCKQIVFKLSPLALALVFSLMAAALTSGLISGGAKAFAAIQDPAAQSGASNQSLEGAWEGTLDFGGVKLRLVLKVSKAAD